jgi:hypothetical protein
MKQLLEPAGAAARRRPRRSHPDPRRETVVCIAVRAATSTCRLPEIVALAASTD